MLNLERYENKMSKKYTKLRLLIFPIIVFMSFFLLLEGLTRLFIFILPSSYTPKFKGLQEGIIISDNVLNHKWRPSIKVRGKARGIETVMYVNGQSWVGQRNVNKKKRFACCKKIIFAWSLPVCHITLSTTVPGQPNHILS